MGLSAMPQKPVWPWLRETLQLRGQSTQGLARSFSWRTGRLKESKLAGEGVIIGEKHCARQIEPVPGVLQVQFGLWEVVLTKQLVPVK